jgi:hypothetical protein
LIVRTEEELLEAGGYGFAKVENFRLQFRPEMTLAERVRVGTEVSEATQISFLARMLAGLGKEYGPFAGAMLWITDPTTIPDGPRAIALQGMELQRRAFSEIRPMELAPVHYFEAHEFEVSLSMFVLAIVGGLDGYYYPNWGCPNYFLRLGSTIIEILSCDSDLIAETRAALDRMKWVKYGIPAAST